MLFKKQIIYNKFSFKRVNFYTKKGYYISCVSCYLYARDTVCKYNKICTNLPKNSGTFNKDRYYKYIFDETYYRNYINKEENR